MILYFLRWFFEQANNNHSVVRCGPMTLALSVLAILLLMVRCDG